MKKLSVILLATYLFFSTNLFSFNVSDYDLNQPLTHKIKPKLSQLEDPQYVVNIIDKITNAIKNDPDNLRLYRVRNNYLYILWDITNNKTEKAQLAKLGLKYSIECIKKFPYSPEGYLMRAMFLGVYMLTKGVLNALYVSKDMRLDLIKAYKLDPNYSFGLAAQVLGRLYFKLPPFPISFGDFNKARKFLYKAYEIDPNYAYTYMYLAELEAANGNKEKALSFINKIQTIKPTTWFEKLIKIWTLRTVDKAKSILKNPKTDRYNYDFLTDPIRHKKVFDKNFN